MRKIIIAGNWKMNGTLTETESLINDIKGSEFNSQKATMVVCPPFTALAKAAELLNGTEIGLGAQDMSHKEKGAYTGEISADMVLTAGATYCILGHSERRQYHGEDDLLVNAKAKRALAAGLTPIICIGETIEQREAGETEKVVGSQVDGALSGLTADDLKKTVLAYEPIWAIGTGKTATPEMAQDFHRFIREQMAKTFGDAAEEVSILYGGSMKPGNAGDLLSQPDIDGGLIGGASLKAADFVAIMNAV
jgi:triosephosphate isomerase